eukprot:5355535-Pleurochrysis_carterae.AAC.1
MAVALSVRWTIQARFRLRSLPRKHFALVTESPSELMLHDFGQGSKKHSCEMGTRDGAAEGQNTQYSGMSTRNW